MRDGTVPHPGSGALARELTNNEREDRNDQHTDTDPEQEVQRLHQAADDPNGNRDDGSNDGFRSAGDRSACQRYAGQLAHVAAIHCLVTKVSRNRRIQAVVATVR